MHIAIPHKSNKITVLTKVKQALTHGRSQLTQYATINQERWEGETLHFDATLQGKNVTGTLQVSDTELIIDAKLPLLWRIFEGRIEKMIAEQLKTIS